MNLRSMEISIGVAISLGSWAETGVSWTTSDASQKKASKNIRLIFVIGRVTQNFTSAWTGRSAISAASDPDSFIWCSAGMWPFRMAIKHSPAGSASCEPPRACV